MLALQMLRWIFYILKVGFSIQENKGSKTNTKNTLNINM